jgi:hypothetical protein
MLDVPSINMTGEAARRLLGSSAAYRMAVRRMLLRSLSGSVANSITTATGPSILRSTGRVASAPDEMGGDALGQAVRLLQSSAGQASATVLRSGTLDDALQVSEC